MLAQRGNATRCSLKRVGRSEKVFTLSFLLPVCFVCVHSFHRMGSYQREYRDKHDVPFFYICFFNFANSTFDVIIKLEEKRMENIEIKNIPLACIPKKATRLFD